MRRKGKMFIRFLLSVFAVVLVVTAIVFIYLLVISKGKIPSFTDETGNAIPSSISEKIKVKINGTELGMFIRGKDSNNPILIFIHGGPGVPEYFLNEIYQTDLENHFTVCWLESRGSGLSYNNNLKGSDITTQQLVEDTISVTEYLINRFKKGRIYLMGHSFGTFIGIKVADERPDLYYAYIGMAQAVGNVLGGAVSNTLTYEYMSNVFASRNEESCLKKLEMWSIKNNDGTVIFNQKYLGQLDDLKHRAGCGTMHNMDSVITGIFLPQINSQCYTLHEKVNYWRGKAFMKSTEVYKEFTDINIVEPPISLKIPIYFFSGVYDYTCPYPLSLEYYKMLEAPLKGFYTFDNSAHSPLWEEPNRTIDILVKDVLQRTNKLSDYLE